MPVYRSEHLPGCTYRKFKAEVLAIVREEFETNTYVDVDPNCTCPAVEVQRVYHLPPCPVARIIGIIRQEITQHAYVELDRASNDYAEVRFC
jgi:hypothetical protein